MRILPPTISTQFIHELKLSAIEVLEVARRSPRWHRQSVATPAFPLLLGAKCVSVTSGISSLQSPEAL